MQKFGGCEGGQAIKVTDKKDLRLPSVYRWALLLCPWHSRGGEAVQSSPVRCWMPSLRASLQASRRELGSKRSRWASRARQRGCQVCCSSLGASSGAPVCLCVWVCIVVCMCLCVLCLSTDAFLGDTSLLIFGFRFIFCLYANWSSWLHDACHEPNETYPAGGAAAQRCCNHHQAAHVFFVSLSLHCCCRSPALPAPRLDFYKAQVLDALDHQYDDADSTAYR